MPGPLRMLPIPSKTPLPILEPSFSASAFSCMSSRVLLTLSKAFLSVGAIVISPTLAPTLRRLTIVSLVKVLRDLFNAAFLCMASSVEDTEVSRALSYIENCLPKSPIAAFKTLTWKTPPTISAATALCWAPMFWY